MRDRRCRDGHRLRARQEKSGDCSWLSERCVLTASALAVAGDWSVSSYVHLCRIPLACFVQGLLSDIRYVIVVRVLDIELMGSNQIWLSQREDTDSDKNTLKAQLQAKCAPGSAALRKVHTTASDGRHSAFKTVCNSAH